MARRHRGLRCVALDRGRSRSHHMTMRQLSLILLLACTACNASRPGPPLAPPATPVLTPLAQIHSMIGSAACTDSTQCKSLAIGASACGGPDSYLAYSTAITASAPLQALAMRVAQQRHTELMNSGSVSACQFIVDPGAQCRAGTCVLGDAPTPAKPRLRPPPEASTKKAA